MINYKDISMCYDSFLTKEEDAKEASVAITTLKNVIIIFFEENTREEEVLTPRDPCNPKIPYSSIMLGSRPR
jgi:hypothetical protein